MPNKNPRIALKHPETLERFLSRMIHWENLILPSIVQKYQEEIQKLGQLAGCCQEDLYTGCDPWGK